MRYICDTRDVPDHFYPTDIKERCQIDQWLEWNQYSFRPAMSPRFFVILSHLLMGGPDPEEAFLAEKDAEIENNMRYLEESLQFSEYLTGDNLTIADIQLYFELTQGMKLLSRNYESFPKVGSWVERMNSI